MKHAKPVLAALAASAFSALNPVKAQIAPILLSELDHTTVSTPLLGAAYTSDSKLGVSNSGLFNYNNDLSSGSGAGIGNTGISDAGYLSDTHYLAASSGGVNKMNISTTLSDGVMGLSGFAVDAISSAFDYNGSQHFAIIDGGDDLVKYFEWGNNTPVAIGPNVGSNHSGLEVITDGSVSNLSNIPLLVSRDTESGSMLDQYFGGTIVGSYRDGGQNLITDITYDSTSGVLTASHQIGRGGGMTNYDFSTHAIPEPKSVGLLFGAGALATAAYRRRKK